MRKSTARLQTRIHVAAIAMCAGLLASPAFANELGLERVIHLEGTSNTRDIGGYVTDGLRTIRQGQIIRSENLSRLTAGDFEKLEALGVKTVIDLRTDAEHEDAPTTWLGDNPPRFYHLPVGDADNDWFRAQSRMLDRNRFTEGQSLVHMQEGYRMIAEEGLSSYRQLMDLVLDPSNWPILIHCNAGKDRTGVAITLILDALGVDPDTIMEEFLLTNEINRSEAKAAFMAKRSRKYSNGRRSPSAAAWYPIVGVRPEMLEAFYASVAERHGSMGALLAELGVDHEARGRLIASLTREPAKSSLVE